MKPKTFYDSFGMNDSAPFKLGFVVTIDYSLFGGGKKRFAQA